MAYKAWLNIKTNLDMVQDICDLKIVERINEHATLYLKAVVYESSNDSYIKETKEGDQIYVYVATEGGEQRLFKGIIANVTIYAVRNVYYLELEGVSSSFKTDITVISRSFQNAGLQYSQLIKQVMSAYPGADILDTVSQGRCIEKFTMQYKETDWAFIKRLASHFNVGILPALDFEEPHIYFGIPNGVDRGAIEKYRYHIEKDIAAYMVARENYNRQWTELDAVRFIVETEYSFEIGDTVTYQDISLIILEKEVSMEKGALAYRYSLSTRDGATQNLTYNEKIVGLTLMGWVIDVLCDTVKVHLEIDSEQDVETAWQFPYTTPYTAAGNTGWYIMPEVGDTALIYFPNHEEYNGMGMNSFRANTSESDKISDPDTKYLRTSDGKEIKLDKNEILITCSNWSDEETGEENIIYIRLNENSGIEIQSTKPVNISTDSDMNMTSQKEIIFNATEEIAITCKTSQILLNDAVDIAGKEVKIN